MRTAVKTTIAKCDQFITARIEFDAGSLTGRPAAHTAGRIYSGPDYDRFMDDRDVIDYAVFSYGTPIAWHTHQGWYIVQQKFSVTTSKHQNKVRANAR